MQFNQLSRTQLEALEKDLAERYENYRDQKLNLDLTRGKPAADQLDLANSLDGILEGFYLLQDGTDVRNYGGLLGIPEARELGSLFMDIDPAEVLVGGNSSLNLMHTYVDFMVGSYWSKQAGEDSTLKFLCPVPGYDRHFTICEHFGIEMIPVPLLASGPDMDQIEALVASDPDIKGIWCVPKYSNPTGQTYTDETVRRLAKLPAIAGPDFRVLWDNAYAVHHLGDNKEVLLSIMAEAKKLSTEGNIAIFASTSKVTFAGAGIAFMGLSTSGLKAFEKYLATATIGFDKVNQLRHVRFLVDAAGIEAHMEKHKALIKPKFDAVLSALSEHLDGKGIATWTSPNGGYFISLDTLPGLASKVVKLAGDIGVKLTPAGATFPYGRDPEDRNIRIAPTYPTIESLQKALEVFVICVQLASVRQLLDPNNE